MPALSPFAATVAKSAFAVAIFCSSIFGWWQFQGDITRRMPLPGRAGDGGPCSVWFAGSSTIRRWTSMAVDMAPWRTQNRGVEGAMVQDIAARLENEKTTKAPAIIVFYLGENDIAHGATAEQASTRVADMVTAIGRKMPGVRTLVVGLKPSPKRWGLRAQQLRYNAMIASFARTRSNTTFVDFGDKLLVAGKPGPYYDDSGIHLNPRGYRLWGHEMKQALAGLPGVAACIARSRAS